MGNREHEDAGEVNGKAEGGLRLKA